jgi:hypothetical protein
MTREEIKLEAEEQVNVCTPYHPGSFIQGYIAAAETWQAKNEKQKEINKELVDENEALKFAARMSEKVEKQLREENEKLKKQIEQMQDTSCPDVFCEDCTKDCEMKKIMEQANEGLDLDKIADEVEQDIKEQKVK